MLVGFDPMDGRWAGLRHKFARCMTVSAVALLVASAAGFACLTSPSFAMTAGYHTLARSRGAVRRDEERDPVVPCTEVLPAVAEPAHDRGADGPCRRRVRGEGVMIAVIPAAITLAFSLVGAGRQLWRTEHATWWAATLPTEGFWRLIGRRDVVIAPYYLFMGAWITVFGDSPLAMHMASILAMSLGAGLVALLGWRMFDARVGLIAGLLFAVVPGVTRYAQEARPYAFALVGATLATLLLWDAVEHRSVWRWVGYAAALTLTGAAHLVALGVLAAHAVLIGLHVREGWLRHVAQWLAAVALALLPLAPMVYLAIDQTEQIAWIQANVRHLVTLPGAIMWSSFTSGAIVALAALAIYSARERRRTAVLAAWALIPPVVYYVTFDHFHFFLARYLLFTLPAWVLLAAVAVREVTSTANAAAVTDASRSRRTMVAGIVLASAVLVLGVVDHLSVRRDVQLGEPDYRAAAAFIVARRVPGDGIAYDAERWAAHRAIAYEMRSVPDPPRDVFLAVSPRVTGVYWEGIECPVSTECLGDVRRIWLMTSTTSEDPYASLPIERADVLKKRFEITETKLFTGVRVLLLQAKGA